MFDWNEYLELAKKLESEQNPPEANYRCAISRAYYAAYCIARNKALAEGGGAFDGRNGKSSHAEVRDYYATSPDPDRQDIGEYLYQMHTRRKEADYNDRCPNYVNYANYVIMLSEGVMDLIEGL